MSILKHHSCRHGALNRLLLTWMQCLEAMASSKPNAKPANPLVGHRRYVKVADLSSGSFGFVQLAHNIESNELVAIKFIERGDGINRYVEVGAG